jgi:hypothetical protein
MSAYRIIHVNMWDPCAGVSSDGNPLVDCRWGLGAHPDPLDTRDRLRAKLQEARAAAAKHWTERVWYCHNQRWLQASRAGTETSQI